MKQTLMLVAAMMLGAAALAAPAGKESAGTQTQDWHEPTTGMAFRPLPKGCFKMGAAIPQAPQPRLFWGHAGYTRNASEDELPVHEVCVDAFWMGKNEVRATEWQRVMGGAPVENDTLPVTGITWEQAGEFARRLGELSLGKLRFRLPTEAEWEYACRAGSAKDIDPLADSAHAYAWHEFTHAAPQPVGGLKPNAFGLHDMLGNVWEWVADSYDAGGYARHALFNPRIEAGAGKKVLRGGSFRTERVQVRCAMRSHHAPQTGTDYIGLRLVRER